MSRHLIIILVALLGLGTSVRAQVGEPRRTLSLGVNAGVTMNRMSFDPTIKQSWKSAFTSGLTLRYTHEKYFSMLCAIQAELNYANLGWKEVIETSSDTYERDIHYIQLPIVADLAWGYERRGLMFHFMAGPQFGYAFSESEKRGGDFSDATLQLRPNQIYQQYDMPVENKLDYGITAGLGLELNTKVGHFMIDGRYYFALGDIYGNGKTDTFARSAHGTIVIKASYLFDLIRR